MHNIKVIDIVIHPILDFSKAQSNLFHGTVLPPMNTVEKKTFYADKWVYVSALGTLNQKD